MTSNDLREVGVFEVEWKIRYVDGKLRTLPVNKQEFSLVMGDC